DRMLGESSRSIDSPKCRFAWLEDQPPDWSVHIGQALGPVQRLHELTRSAASRLVVAVCPAPWQVSPQASNGEGVRAQAGIAEDGCLRSRRPFETIEEFCRTHQIPVCDLSRSFAGADQPERLYLKNVAALSPAGHTQYARELAAFVVAQLAGEPP